MTGPAEEEVSVGWRVWMAENLSRGVDRARIVERLVREGVAEALAKSTLASIETSPRCVRGLARAWVDLDAWSPETLAARLGDVRVGVTVDRDDDPDYPRTFRRRTRDMSVAALVDRMRSGPSNDVYLVAQNHALQRSALGVHFEATLRAPASALASKRASLWMGPAGTISPFHHDAMDLLALQLHGRKRWRLIAPTDRAWLAHLTDPGAPHTLLDPARDGVDGVVVREVVVEEGDALFVPASTWHHVVAETASVTISLTALGSDRAWLDTPDGGR